MLRTMTIAVCTFALMACSGCGLRNYGEHLGELRPGLTLTQVQSVLGPPTTVRTKRSYSAWLYCRDIFGFRAGTTLTAWFTDRRLVDVSIYHNQPAVSCHDFQQAFTWDQAPYAGHPTFK